MPESKFEIRPYGKGDDIMLIRLEEREVKSVGLPPIISQTIMMNKSEIEGLIPCLQKMK